MNEQQQQPPPPGWRPVPDPTVLTTEALHREIASLGTDVRREIFALRELLDTKTRAQSSFVAERFATIQERFVLIEQQRQEQKSDTNAALSAALSSQKEAVTKQDEATKDTISKLSVLFGTTTDALGEKIDDVKDRLGKLESSREGASETRTEGRAALGSIVAVFGVVIAVVALALSAYIATRPRSSPAPVVVTVPAVTP